MKKRDLLSLTAAIGLMLTSCAAPKETADIAPHSTAESADQEESQKTESLPTSQEYVSSDGTYKIILLEGLTQTDIQLQAGSTMMGLDGGTEWSGFSGISLGSFKSNVLGNPDGLESLEDYADYITAMILNDSDVSVSWEDTDAPSTDGAERCLARMGIAKSGLSRAQAYGYYVESADSYFSVVIIGNSDDVEAARQILSLEILSETPLQRGTIDFINGMTIVLDSINGASVRETFKAMHDQDAGEEYLEFLSSQARQSLSDSWGVENAADLMEMADQLIMGHHNQDALQFLNEYGGTNETDRNALDARLKEQNLNEGDRISLMAAYDAWAAYGENAIAAWDLSRVGTIMGFGYASGYCTYEEALDKTLEAAVKAQECFSSWEDFNKSYLYGYSYWAEESPDDPESGAAERATLISILESHANGPFAVDWNIELKKEW